MNRLNKIFLYILMIFCLPMYTMGQKFNWAKHEKGTTGSQEVTSISSNSSDTALLTAITFSGSITLNGTTYTAQGGNDVVVYASKNDGSIYWVDHLRSVGSRDRINDMVHFVSGSNDTWYVTGQHDDTTRSTVSSNSQNYGTGSFAVSLVSPVSGGGSTVLMPPLGATKNQTPSEGKSITIDGSGNLYVLGEYRDSIILNNTVLLDSGQGDVFFTKINRSTMTPLVSQRIYSAGRVEAVSVEFDAVRSQLVVCGNFSSTVFFSSTDSLTPTAAGRKDVFIARYSTAGAYVAGSASKIIHGTNNVVATDMILDASSSPIITGYFSGSFSAGNVNRSSNGGEDVFAVGVNVNNSINYANSYGGNGNDRGSKASNLSANVNLFYASYRSSIVNFGSVSVTTGSTQDAMIFALDSSGGVQGAKGGLMTLSTDVVSVPAFNSNTTSVYIGGGFRGRIKFGSVASYNSTSAGNPDAYFAQIKPHSVYCEFNDTINVAGDFRTIAPQNLRLCQGLDGLLKSRASNPYTYQWYQNGNAITGATSDSLLVKAAGNYKLQLTLSSKNCSEFTDSFTVALDTNPVVSIQTDTNCINTPNYAMNLMPSFNSATDSLFGRGVNNSVQNRYFPATAGVGTDTVIFKRTDLNSCVGMDTAFFITYPKPIISVISANIKSYCQEDRADTLNFAISNAADTSYYSMNPAWGIKDGQLFRCDSLPARRHTINYHVTDTNGCTADSTFNSLLEIKVKPNVVLNLSPSRSCKNSVAFNLSGGSPTGGSSVYYLGTGVTDTALGKYDPSISQFANDTIQYVYLASNGCSDTASDVLTLDSVPVIQFNFSDTICANDPIYVMKAQPIVRFTGDSGSYFGHPAISGKNFFPSVSGVGKHKVFYGFKDTRGCYDSASTFVEVKALPTVSQSYLGSYCENNGTVKFQTGVPSGGQYYYKSHKLENNLFKPDTHYVNYGNDTVYYEYTDSFKCVNRAFSLVNVKKKPTLSLNSIFFNNLCDNSEEINLENLGVSEVSPPPSSGGFFSFDSSSKIAVFNPTNYALIPRLQRPALTYVFYDSLIGCSDTVGVHPDIKLSPIVSIEHSGAACAGLPHTLTGKGALTWVWSTGDTTPSIQIIQDSVSSYKAIGQLGICFDSAEVTVEITEGELITAIDDSISMKKGTNVTIDPLERLYSTDTLALIGKFNVFEGPLEARVFDTTDGVIPRFKSNMYYEPNLDFRRIDSVLYEVCNINCLNNCDTAKVVFNVLGNPYEFIPNAFTPNGDGVNDTWVVPGIEAYPNSELLIYNRWGDLLFQAAPYKNDWAGQTNKGIGGGDKVVDGTYFYVLNTNDGEPLKGIIELKTR